MGTIHVGRTVPLGRSIRMGVGLQRTHFFGCCSCRKNVPRDASQQALVGEEVAVEEARQDDIAFFHNSEGRITHVGICDGTDQVIHASGEVRVDRSRAVLIRHEDGSVTQPRIRASWG